MLQFGSFKDIDYEFYDEIWLIVRSVKNIPKQENVYWKPELSPTKNLFFTYLKWKKAGEWNLNTFQNKYVPQFIEELHNPESIKALNELYYAALNKNMLCVCYCPTEELCHRSIIKGLLQGAMEKYQKGTYIMDSSNDYSHYYALFKQKHIIGRNECYG